MSHHFTSLPHSKIRYGITLKADADRSIVSRHTPATEVMTDLLHAMAYTINPTSSINDAESKMILCGVRLLFVTDSDGELVGLITATDVLGERPVNYLREHGGEREDIMVQEIMTHRDDIEAINYPDVVRASVGDIIATLHDAGRQHVLVVDQDSVRGLFSATEVARRIGEAVDIEARARTFAELEAALVAH